jgi:hypothetical protein
VFTRAGDALDSFRGPSIMRHSTATHPINVEDPEHARSYCYFTVIVGSGLDHWGRYIDRFGVRDGKWLFTERRILIDGQVEGGWAATRDG